MVFPFARTRRTNEAARELFSGGGAGPTDQCRRRKGANRVVANASPPSEAEDGTT